MLFTSSTTTVNHDNVRHWDNISNCTLPSDRGEQDHSNGVKHIEIRPLITKLESHTYVVPMMEDSQLYVLGSPKPPYFLIQAYLSVRDAVCGIIVASDYGFPSGCRLFLHPDYKMGIV